MWNDRNDRNLAGLRDMPLLDRVFSTLDETLWTAREIGRMMLYRIDLRRSRQDLRALSDEQLRDVGLTRRQAEAEASRPFFPD